MVLVRSATFLFLKNLFDSLKLLNYFNSDL